MRLTLNLSVDQKWDLNKILVEAVRRTGFEGILLVSPWLFVAADNNSSMADWNIDAFWLLIRGGSKIHFVISLKWETMAKFTRNGRRWPNILLLSFYSQLYDFYYNNSRMTDCTQIPMKILTFRCNTKGNLTPNTIDLPHLSRWLRTKFSWHSFLRR